MPRRKRLSVHVNRSDLMATHRQGVRHPTADKASAEDQNFRHGTISCAHPFIISPVKLPSMDNDLER
jgi:hypothetical protein